jgi:hypothetical protein
MKLSTCLNSADIHVLRKIAKRQNLNCKLHSKHDLMQAILTHFQDGREIAQTLSKLSNTHKQMLVRLALNKRSSLTREDLLAVATKTLGEQTKISAEDLYRDLLEDGWLFRSPNQSTGLYSLPDDLRGKIEEWFIHSTAKTLRFLPSQPLMYRDDQTAILRDIITFLHFIKQHDVRLTQDGSIFKRQQLQLFQLMEVQEQPVPGTGWRFGYGRRFREYPDRFALLYDYCFMRGWIEERSDGALCLKESADAWIIQSDIDKIRDLYAFWFQIYSKTIAQLQLAIHVIIQSCKDKWVYVESLRSVLEEYLQPYYYDTVDDIVQKRIIQMLRCIGLIQIGQVSEEQQVIKLSKLGMQLFFQAEIEADENSVERKPDAIIIQPNLEILVTDPDQSRIDFELARFADLVSADPIRIYRITPASIKRYIRDGNTLQNLQSFLQSVSATPLPGSVEQRLHQWFSEYGKIRSFTCVLIECEDEEVREEVLQIPGVIACIEEVIGDRYILVSAGQIGRIVEYLERVGKVIVTQHDKHEVL